MSFSLGPAAACGELTADQVEAKKERVIFSSTVSTGADLPKVGVQFLAPPANPTNYGLGAGAKRGDVVEFIHANGANDAVITCNPPLHGGNTTITLGGGSASVRLVWSGAEWYILSRSSNNAAAANAVANLPVIA
jgi:hypothetical protein